VEDGAAGSFTCGPFLSQSGWQTTASWFPVDFEAAPNYDAGASDSAAFAEETRPPPHLPSSGAGTGSVAT
jgi:hypothetical protein